MYIYFTVTDFKAKHILTELVSSFCDNRYDKVSWKSFENCRKSHWLLDIYCQNHYSENELGFGVEIQDTTDVKQDLLNFLSKHFIISWCDNYYTAHLRKRTKIF